jgi:hypothetical protein
VDAVGAVDIEPDLAQDTVLVDLAQDTAVADLDDPETQPAPLWQLGKQEAPSDAVGAEPAPILDTACGMGAIWSNQIGTSPDSPAGPGQVMAHAGGYISLASGHSVSPFGVASGPSLVHSLSQDGTLKGTFAVSGFGSVTSTAAIAGEVVFGTTTGQILHFDKTGGIQLLWEADDSAAVWDGGFATALYGAWTATEGDEATGQQALTVHQRDPLGVVQQSWTVSLQTDKYDQDKQIRSLQVDPDGMGGLWATIRQQSFGGDNGFLLRLGSQSAGPVLGGKNTQIELLRVRKDGSILVCWGGQPNISVNGISFWPLQLQLISKDGIVLASQDLPGSNVVCPDDGLCLVLTPDGLDVYSPEHGRIGWRDCSPGYLVPVRGAPTGHVATYLAGTLSLLDWATVAQADLGALIVKSPAQCDSGSCTPHLTANSEKILDRQVVVDQAVLLPDGRMVVRGHKRALETVNYYGKCLISKPWIGLLDADGGVNWEWLLQEADTSYPYYNHASGDLAAGPAGVAISTGYLGGAGNDDEQVWWIPSGPGAPVATKSDTVEQVAVGPDGVFATTWGHLIHMTTTGTLLWQQQRGPGQVRDLLASPTGEVTLAVYDNGMDSYVVRVSGSGAWLWQRQVQNCSVAELLADGDALWAFCNRGTYAAHLMRFDSAGNFASKVPVPWLDKVYVLPDGDFAMFGHAPQGNAYWLQRLGPDGNSRWKRALPGAAGVGGSGALLFLPNGKVRLVGSRSTASPDELAVQDDLFMTDFDFPKTVPCGSPDSVETCPGTVTQKPWLVQVGTTIAAAPWDEGTVLVGVQPAADGQDDVRVDWLDQDGKSVASTVVEAVGSQWPAGLAVRDGQVAVVVQQQAEAASQAKLLVWSQPGGPPEVTVLPIVQPTPNALVWAQAATWFVGGVTANGDSSVVRLANGSANSLAFPGLTGLTSTKNGVVAAAPGVLTWLDSALQPIGQAKWQSWDAIYSKNSCSAADSVMNPYPSQHLLASADDDVFLLGRDSLGTSGPAQELFGMAWGPNQGLRWQRLLNSEHSIGPAKLSAVPGGKGYFAAFVTPDGPRLQRLGATGEYLWQYNVSSWPSATIVGLDALPQGRVQLVLSLPGPLTAVLRP